MLLSLKFRGDLETIRDASAKQTLLSLQARVREDYGYLIDLEKRGVEKYEWVGIKGSWKEKLALAGCMVAMLVGITLMLVGLNAVLTWLF